MAVRRWFFTVLGCALGTIPSAASAEAPTAGAILEVLQASPSRLYEFLARHVTSSRRDGPQWLVERSRDEVDPSPQTGEESTQLVLQQDRRDGTDLLTLRQPLLTRGALRAYAGAGLNRAAYWSDRDDEPAVPRYRRRNSSLGAAAELGAEFRVSEQLMVSADLRWAEFEPAATLLRRADGPVGADPVAVGVSVGWRF